MNKYICKDMSEVINKNREFFLVIYVINEGALYQGQEIDNGDIFTNMFETKESAINFIVEDLKERCCDDNSYIYIEKAINDLKNFNFHKTVWGSFFDIRVMKLQ